MVKIKLIIAFMIIAIFALRIWQSTGCRQFVSFKFNPIAIKISVESNINTDRGIERNIARLFHNKITVGVFEFTRATIAPFDLAVMLEILGPLGLILLISSCIYVLKSKHFFSIAHFSLMPISSLAAVLLSDSKLVFYLLSFSLYSFSMWGFSYLFKSKYAFLLIFLIPITLWYFAFNWQMPQICHEIFFN